jgi:hypothetical protein
MVKGEKHNMVMPKNGTLYSKVYRDARMLHANSLQMQAFCSGLGSEVEPSVQRRHGPRNVNGHGIV